MTDEVNPHIAPIVDELIKRSHDEDDPEIVRDVVTRLVAEFDGAPVQAYVDILVLKEATDELDDMDASRPIAP